MKLRYLLLVAIIAAAPGVACAGSVSGTLSITVAPPTLALVINPSSASLACSAAAGTVVSSLSATGGDGNTVTFAISPTDASYVVNASNQVVIASGGILAADCGKTTAYTITATQP